MRDMVVQIMVALRMTSRCASLLVRLDRCLGRQADRSEQKFDRMNVQEVEVMGINSSQ